MCRDLPNWRQLKSALQQAVVQDTSGFQLQMWATVVNRDGVVCAVAFSGGDRGDQWPGSRAISAQKANTANAFSLPGLALSSGNLWSAVQGTSKANSNTKIGGSLYGLQESNPVDTHVAYRGNPKRYGQRNDPMVGGRIGGINVFGGGLALYNPEGKLVGGLGLSGDTSCADHNKSWHTRHNLGLDYLATAGASGVSGDAARPDNIVYDAFNGDGNGVTDVWEQPTCSNTSGPTALPMVQ